MTERRFLSFLLTEGILLSILGLVMLILPKITTLTFGALLCLSFIIYGGYKVINAIVTRFYTKHYLLNIFIGFLLCLIGLVLLINPMFNLLLMTSFIGVYFILESISFTAFAMQTKNSFVFWWNNLVVAFIQFMLGLIIIIGLPATAFWVVGVLVGINFLITGMIMLGMYLSAKSRY